jgi:hypothetical protein
MFQQTWVELALTLFVLDRSEKKAAQYTHRKNQPK